MFGVFSIIWICHDSSKIHSFGSWLVMLLYLRELVCMQTSGLKESMARELVWCSVVRYSRVTASYDSLLSPGSSQKHGCLKTKCPSSTKSFNCLQHMSLDIFWLLLGDCRQPFLSGRQGQPLFLSLSLSFSFSDTNSGLKPDRGLPAFKAEQQRGKEASSPRQKGR